MIQGETLTVQVRSPAPASRATLRHRKSVDKLTTTQVGHLRAAYRGAMALSDNRSFWYFAGWHGEPFGWCEHHTPLFLPWHRAYLHDFELALQDQIPGVALPWWDWTTSNSLPGVYTAAEADGQVNPLLGSEIRVYRSGQVQQAPPRAPGASPRTPGPPYKQQWDAAMRATSFTDFQSGIEQLHDTVHVWVGGIMQDIQWAAYDPIFYAHHVMIDRAWRIWQHNHPGALPPQHLLDVALRPNGTRVRDVLDVKALGYDYAGMTAHAPGTV